MQYRSLVGVYDRLDATSSSLEKTEIFAEAGDLLPELSLLLRGRLFATHVETGLGVEARSLKRNQTTLEDF
jgi:DNA ligase-1